jgi:hypothetical protein
VGLHNTETNAIDWPPADLGSSLHGNNALLTTKFPNKFAMAITFTQYWVFGPLTKISHIQDGLLTISQAPNHKHQKWYCRRWGRLPPNNGRLEQICVPPFLSLLDGLVLLINKT